MLPRVLILLFGTLPSLVLSAFAGLLVYRSLRDDWPLVVWGSVAIISCIPFWLLSFGPPPLRLSDRIRIAYIVLLALGILSAAPVLFTKWVLAALAASAIITAIWLICILACSPEAENN